MAHILIAEDDLTSSLILKQILKQAGHQVQVAKNGTEVLEWLHKTPKPFDVILSDWMMPAMDGIELIRHIRKNPPQPMPILIIVTSLSSEPARLHALQAGSDDYLSKPYDAQMILECIQNNLKRRHPNVESPKSPLITYPKTNSLPAFPGVGLTASTGGPMALCEVIGGIKNRQAAYFIVVHGPEWMLKTFAPRLQQETPLKVVLAEDGMKIEPGSYYLAPGERHMLVKPNLTLGVVNQPPINFVRPAADPLFQTLAQVFGAMSMGVVMTGMGNDGRAGVQEIHQRGGIVLAQDPVTTAVSSMPKHAIETGCVADIVGLDELAGKIDFYTHRLGKSLKS